MLYRVFISIVVLFLSFLFLFVPNLHAQSSDIYISEIQFDGSTVGEHDKWIELYNPTDTSKNLSGYSLAFKSGKPFTLDGLSIASNSTLIILNNVSPTSSLLNNYSTVRTNLLHAFNSSNNPYIHVQLYSGGNLISSFVKNEAQTRELMRTKTIKKSIEIDQDGSFKLSKSLYWETNNFGTPGRVSILPAKEASPKILLEAIPISSAVENNIAVDNSKSVPLLETQLTTQPNFQPTLQSITSPVPVDVSKLSEIKLSIPNQSKFSRLDKEIKFSSIPKSRFSSSLYPSYSQLPLVLVTFASLIKSIVITTYSSTEEFQTA
jgi:hypothetical protein